jgi:predicted Rossmann fold nucleotide-binding protein DprA/Smf involved in DNA uptake
MNAATLSPDGQATALLAGRFGKGNAKPLTLTEFNKVAKALHQKGLRPSDLFARIPDELPINSNRISSLMSRGTTLALAVESWAQVGIAVVSRADQGYPARFKRLLKSGATPILFYCGNLSLLERPTVSVVGSRDATEAGLQFAKSIGERAASESIVIVSGDARGVDRAAMEGALDNGGEVVGILADSLSRAVLSKRYRKAVSSGKLLLLSHVEPEARFSIAQAMERNRYLYAAGDIAIVADSDVKGGTWNGAVENLKHLWAPAFVRTGHQVREGNDALLQKGLIELPDSWVGQEKSLVSLFEAQMRTAETLPLFSGEKPEISTSAQISDHDLFFKFFCKHLLQLLGAGMTTSEVAEAFQLELSQTEAWMNRATESGLIQFSENQNWRLTRK